MPGFPRGGPLRVALLSDLHVGSPHDGPGKLGAIVRRTNAARPDLVLLAGDFVVRGVLFGTYVPPEISLLTIVAAPPGPC